MNIAPGLGSKWAHGWGSARRQCQAPFRRGRTAGDFHNGVSLPSSQDPRVDPSLHVPCTTGTALVGLGRLITSGRHAEGINTRLSTYFCTEYYPWLFYTTFLGYPSRRDSRPVLRGRDYSRSKLKYFRDRIICKRNPRPVANPTLTVLWVSSGESLRLSSLPRSGGLPQTPDL